MHPSLRQKVGVTVISLVALAVMGLMVAGCGANSGTSSSSSAAAAPLRMLVTGSGPFVSNWNAYSNSSSAYVQGVLGFVYEPLMQYNILKAGQIYPWLATSWTWSNGGKTLTLQTRPGVTWSDGKPFSASDVAFTFNLMKRYPALNVYGLTFKSAAAPSTNEATITFANPAYGQLYVISQVLIVPEHIWLNVKNPVTYTAPNPVGTGPMTVESVTTQAITLTKNPHYWQPGLPKVPKVIVSQFASNTAGALSMEQGNGDWAWLDMPDYQKLFTSKNPNNHVYLPPIGDQFFLMNVKRYPFGEAAVRKALSLALYRDQNLQDRGVRVRHPGHFADGVHAAQLGELPGAAVRFAHTQLRPGGGQGRVDQSRIQRGKQRHAAHAER